MSRGSDAPIEAVEVRAYQVPTETPESDGTLQWDSTTMVVVEVSAGDEKGLGYTYAETAAARLIDDKLKDLIIGRDGFSVEAAWEAMVAAMRNSGTVGLTKMAVSAVDIALWDLKARLLDVPVVALLGRRRDSVSVYGSGGFTSYEIDKLQEQLAGWVEAGIPRVKMKVGREPHEDPRRVGAARAAIGDHTELFVDANGAYERRQAIAQATAFADLGVTWFEEPVSSDDLDGLRFVRERTPRAMEVAAGEYGFNVDYFRRMTEAGAVDVIQPDVTRCGGFTAFREVGALARSAHVPISAHTAPSLDVHIGCAVESLRHIEYFFDHVRIERFALDGYIEPAHGALHPDLSRSGLGYELKATDMQQFLVYGR